MLAANNQIFYPTEFRLFDKNGRHIGNLLYAGATGNTANRTDEIVTYWYSSKNMRMHRVHNAEGQVAEYDVNAKKGWNEVYVRQTGDASGNQPKEVYVTTDLSKVPDGLKWLVVEVAD